MAILNILIQKEENMQEPNKVTYKNVLEKLEKMGVQVTQEKAPFGKIKNASITVGKYRPIIVKKKSLFEKLREILINIRKR
ncbi:hypothetical protein PGC35_20315 [Psychrobacillus sp. PGGUH221]|uniref:hypothetical protein n=1 Tax=Psychrobacillus sp. PGGUH221 TaxID=3020058 RepID=UPI0035C679D5